jgi:hypothetical protein
MLAALMLCVSEGAPDSDRERAEKAHAIARAAIAKTIGPEDSSKGGA